ncbi:MAG: 50S ribosomal protein L25 [Halobacteriovoraceae bacterium]|nr:50S ribosomal protein L25 [Halobacteriovoraceae bacterium]
MELQLTPREETRLNSKTRSHYASQGLVPAAVHGRSIDAKPCFVNAKKAKHWHRGSMFDVDWNGQAYKASIDEIQYEPVSHKLVHVTFHLVGKNETTHVSIPVKTVGQAPGEKEGGMVHLQVESLSLQGKADDMPEYIEIDVSELSVGSKISIEDLTPPPGTEWYQVSEGQTLATCAHIKVQAVEETPSEAPVEGEASPAAETPETDGDKEAA